MTLAPPRSFVFHQGSKGNWITCPEAKIDMFSLCVYSSPDFEVELT